MSRRSTTMFVAAVTVVVGAVCYRWAVQAWAPDASAATASAKADSLVPHSNSSVTNTGLTPNPAGAMTEGHKELSPEDMLPMWEVAVTSSDAEVRAAAIRGLALAPRVKALPILETLLKDGAYPDRQLVIESMAIMARQHGDADERIRTAFRIEVYDGSDEAISTAAQRALTDLEQDTT